MNDHRRPFARFSLIAVAVIAAAWLASQAVAVNARAGHGNASSTLVVDDVFTLKTADPGHEFEPLTGEIVVKALYSTLLTFRGTNVSKPIPSLAISFKVSSDGLKYTFPLRHGVRFSDGTPLTSADVVFSFNRLINLKASPAFLLSGETVSAPNKYTVVLTSTAPNPALPFILASPQLGILNSRVVRAHGGTDQPNAAQADTAQQFLDGTSAGSGPYVLRSYSTTSQVVLAANPKYWGPRPAFSTVVIRNVPEATQAANVQRGSNELALSLSPTDAQSLRANRKIRVVSTPSPNVIYLQATVDPTVSAVTPNQHIRNAIRYGLNYPEIVAVAGRGSIQAPGIVPNMFLGSLPRADATKFNLTKAKSELAASGITNPSLTLTFASDLVENGISFATLAQKIQSDLQAVGFHVTLDGGPFTLKASLYRSGQEAMGIHPWGPDYPDPNDYLAFLPGGLIGKRVGWPVSADPALVTLGTQAASTVKDSRRAALFQQLQRLLNQVGPVFPLIQPSQTVASSANLTNVGFNAVWAIDVAGVGRR